MKTLNQILARLRHVMFDRPFKKSLKVSVKPPSEPGLEIAEARPERSTVATAPKSEPTELEETQPSGPLLKHAQPQQDSGPRSAIRASDHAIVDAEVTVHPIVIAGGEPLQSVEEQEPNLSLQKKTKRPDSRDDDEMGKCGSKRCANFRRDEADKETPSTTSTWDEELLKLTPDEALAKFEIRASSKEVQDKCERTKKYAVEVLSIIEGVGGVIAEVGSSVFPPSKICFTAVCYLLYTAKRYHQYFADLSYLFETISYFLARFQTHSKTKKDEGLKRILRELLGCFVEICIEAVDMKKNRNKVKLAFRLLMTGEDTVLKDLLTRILRLAELEMQEVAAQIFNKVSNIADMVNSLEERGRRQDDRAEKGVMQDEVADVLCIDPKEEHWRTKHWNFRKQRISTTGQWLLDHDQFKEWSKVDDKQSRSILALEAPGSHGKTFLASKIIEDLRRQHVENTDTKLTHVAYYFFGNSRKDEANDSEKDALASLIWQLTQTDSAFLKVVTDLFRRRPSSRDPSRWTDVFGEYTSGPTDASTMTATIPTYFLVLDGVNHIKNKISESFRTLLQTIVCQRYKTLRIKLLVTGDLGTPEQLGLTKTQFSKIEVSRYISLDLKVFLNYKLECKWPDEKVPERLQPIVNNLVRQNRSFDNLNQILDRFTPADSLEALEAALQDRNTVESCILALSKSNDTAIIKDLDALVPWIVLPSRWPTVDEVKAIISLSRNTNFTPVKVSWPEYLRKTYPLPLLDVVKDRVKSSELMDFFEDPVNQTGLKTLHTVQKEASDMVEKFHPTELQVIENVLLQACGKDLYKRFEFDAFFQAKRRASQTTVRFNNVDGHLKIIVACVQSLSGDSKINTTALHAYAISNIPWHIHEVISSDLTVKRPNWKTNAIKQLHLLFTEESYMRVWLLARGSDAVRKTWLRDDALVSDILGLCDDDRVLQSTKDTTKDWVEELRVKPRALYKDTAKFMADQWLRKDTLEVMSAFRWVWEYDTTDLDPECANDEIAVAEIERVAQSAKKLLNIQTEDVKTLTRIAETMLHCSKYSESSVYCDRALKLDSTYWRATWCSIKASRVSFDFDEELSRLQRLVEEHHELRQWFSPGSIETWKDVLKHTVHVSGKCEQLGLVVDYSKKLLEVAPDDQSTMKFIVDSMFKAKQFSDLREFLKGLRDAPVAAKHCDNLQRHYDKDNVEDRNKLTALFMHCADKVDFHEQIACVVQVDCAEMRWSEWLAMIDAAFKEATKSTAQTERVVALRYYHGLWLYHANQNDKDVRRAMSLWEENLKEIDPADSTPSQQIRSESACKLITAYLDERNRSAPESSLEQARECLKLFKTLPAEAQQSISDRKTDLLIARLCYKYTIDEAEIQKRVKPHMLEALRILENDDPDDDWWGYMLLAEILTPIDGLNALAVWNMLGYLKDLKSLYHCDGQCEHSWEVASEIHCCRDCFDAQFDEHCLAKLRAHKLERRVCNPDHDFIKVSSCESRVPKDNYIYVGEKEVEVKKWIESLKDQYCRTDALSFNQQEGNMASQ